MIALDANILRADYRNGEMVLGCVGVGFIWIWRGEKWLVGVTDGWIGVVLIFHGGFWGGNGSL